MDMTREIQYQRDIPGAYYITMTPGISISTNFRNDFSQHNDPLRCAALEAIRSLPGLQPQFASEKLERIRLVTMVNEEYPEAQEYYRWAKLIFKQPQLAITSRLMGWKLHEIGIYPDGRVILYFYDMWNKVQTEIRLCQETCEIAPDFSVMAPGENGQTKYSYSQCAAGPTIHEESAVHERYVTLRECGKCIVREIVRADVAASWPICVNTGSKIEYQNR